MGISYRGPYADAIGGEDHEGFPAPKPPDGGGERTVGYLAACACGWRGTGTHPPTSLGRAGAERDWDIEHLQPLIEDAAARHTVPAAALVDVIRELRERAEPLREMDSHALYAMALFDVAERLEDLLGYPAPRTERVASRSATLEQAELDRLSRAVDQLAVRLPDAYGAWGSWADYVYHRREAIKPKTDDEQNR